MGTILIKQNIDGGLRMANVLLVVDPQNDFITGALGSEYAKSIVPKIVDKINNFVGLIYVSIDKHDDGYSSTREGSRIPSHCILGTEGFDINPEIYAALKKHGDVDVIQKSYFSLAEHDLSWIVCNLDNDDELDNGSITIIGYVTDICVVSNALAVYNRFDVDVVVDASCCAGTSKEAHLAALTVMRSCLIDVIGE